MKKVILALACLAMVLTGCKDTKALKEAAEKANEACPTQVAKLGEVAGITLGDNAIEFKLNPLPELVEGDIVDKSLIARYLALELQNTNPDLMKLVVDNEFGMKCEIGEGDPVELSSEDMKRISEDYVMSGGKFAPILLPLFNQQLTSKLPTELAEGLTLKEVKLKDGKETFFITVDDDKAKFDDVRGEIVKTLENAEEKVKLSKINLSMLLPLL